MSGVKKNVTFSVDENIKKAFQVECLLNDNEMSTVIETFMESYTRVSKRMAEDVETKE